MGTGRRSIDITVGDDHRDIGVTDR